MLVKEIRNAQNPIQSGKGKEISPFFGIDKGEQDK